MATHYMSRELVALGHQVAAVLVDEPDTGWAFIKFGGFAGKARLGTAV